jgi:hypothetical protein
MHGAQNFLIVLQDIQTAVLPPLTSVAAVFGFALVPDRNDLI